LLARQPATWNATSTVTLMSECCKCDTLVSLTDSSFGPQMVTIRVGVHGEHDDFAVYEKLIRRASIFMEYALKGPWQESTDRIVCLPEFTKRTFGIYHVWLLTGKLRCITKVADDNQHSSTEINQFYRELLNLRDLSHLGHYLIDTTFTDTVCDAILRCCKDLDWLGSQFPIAYGSHFYDVLPPDSRTRSLVADLVVWTTTDLQVDRLRQNNSSVLHSDFLMDVLHAMVIRCTSPGTLTSPLKEPDMSCKYHSHSQWDTCYKETAERYITH
jgi:hypothetical protein